jgi:hypothetical protein
MEVLKRMGLLSGNLKVLKNLNNRILLSFWIAGLDRGTCSEEDICKIKALVPKSLDKYIEGEWNSLGWMTLLCKNNPTSFKSFLSWYYNRISFFLTYSLRPWQRRWSTQPGLGRHISKFCLRRVYDAQQRQHGVIHVRSIRGWFGWWRLI